MRLRVQAGEPWDELVARAVASGWSGIEALSGIPGSTGAVPVQNVGAYGQEVSSVLRAVEIVDAESLEVRRLEASGLGLGYRTSIFKQGYEGLITAVELSLVDSGADASAVGAPFPRPKHSQASHSGIRSAHATMPKPPILLIGALSLKKNGLPTVPRNR